jgi:hypothetical protein
MEEENVPESLIWQHIDNPVSIISHTLSSLSVPPSGPVNAFLSTSRIFSSTTSSLTLSLASNLQCVPALESCAIAAGRFGEEGERTE